VRRQPIEIHAWRRGDDGNESGQRLNDRFDLRERARDGGKSFELGRQIRFAKRRHHTKRRLQRGVKAVFARLARERVPRGRRERDVVRVRQALAAIAIIAEDAGAEAIERGAGRWHEIDRVSWLIHARSAAPTLTARERRCPRARDARRVRRRWWHRRAAAAR